MSEPALGYGILALVALQRLVELAYARRNARRLVEAGGTLVPRDGMAGLVAVHVAWLASIALERLGLGARMPPALALPLLVALLLVEGLRAWTLATLGRRWTVRVVVVPGEAPVARGPYRYLRHPNYVVVTLEILLLPLWLGAWRTAIAVLLPHALTLARRIRREEAAWRAVAGRPLGAPPPPGGPAVTPP